MQDNEEEIAERIVSLKALDAVSVKAAGDVVTIAVAKVGLKEICHRIVMIFHLFDN